MFQKHSLIAVKVLEYDGAQDWGVREFQFLPRKGDVVELWKPWKKPKSLLARVEGVTIAEANFETDISEVTIFVKPL
jgi:hypothetical protein